MQILSAYIGKRYINRTVLTFTWHKRTSLSSNLNSNDICKYERIYVRYCGKLAFYSQGMEGSDGGGGYFCHD